MSGATEFRLKIRHWFIRNGKIVFIGFVVFGIVFMLNKYLMYRDTKKEPETTYTPSVSVLNDRSSVPSSLQMTAETMIEEYVGYCNEGNYRKAFDMLSEDCQKYEFNDSVEQFAKHVLKKMLTPKNYSIQNYSNYDKYYIYEIKYIDDILSTGLTNQEYNFATEKIIFSKNKSGSYDMSVGNFISYDKINNILENDYIKVDIIDRITNYSMETYKVKFTNRTDSTVVVSDGLVSNEVELSLPQEYRELIDSMDIILKPGSNGTYELSFTKFADDGDVSQSLLFSSIRVIEDYKGILGTEEEQQNEIDNAIAKFSVEIPVK